MTPFSTPLIPRSPSSALRILALTLPFATFIAWVAAVTLHASIVIDGVRHFYLDDSQMVSMRYARNLVEGQGLVWNAGERVEGYSNPGWTLIMALVHLAGAQAHSSSLIVKVVAAACGAGILYASLRLRRLLAPSTVLGEMALLFTLAMNADVVFWAANGFETTLLTAVFVWLLVRVVGEAERGAPSRLTIIAAGVLPLIRSDGHLLTAAVALVGFGLASNRHRALRVLPLALLLPAAHLLVRFAYYGDWLPNTFYLRHAGVPGVWRDGARYVRAFVFDYWILLGVAGLGAVALRERRLAWLLSVVAAGGGHALIAGGDAYAHFRFIAPAVPVILVLAFSAVEMGVRSSVRRSVGLAGLTVAAVVAGGMVQRWPIDSLRSWRGKPWDGVVTGRLLDRYAGPDGSVAAADVGALGYFSRRTVIDLTGRTDPVIARGPGRPGADAGARKFDIERSLKRQPDFLLTAGPHDAAHHGEVMFALSGIDSSKEIGPAILASRTFLGDYRDNPVPLKPLLARSAVYVHVRSPERRRVSQWRFPDAPF